jgi:hypothetical protein
VAGQLLVRPISLMPRGSSRKGARISHPLAASSPHARRAPAAFPARWSSPGAAVLQGLSALGFGWVLDGSGGEISTPPT